MLYSSYPDFVLHVVQLETIGDVRLFDDARFPELIEPVSSEIGAIAGSTAMTAFILSRYVLQGHLLHGELPNGSTIMRLERQVQLEQKRLKR